MPEMLTAREFEALRLRIGFGTRSDLAVEFDPLPRGVPDGQGGMDLTLEDVDDA